MANQAFYYKILDAAPPSPLPTSLPATDLDAKDKFIHLSVRTHYTIDIAINTALEATDFPSFTLSID